MSRPKTIFCDLDGTLVKHSNPIDVQNPNLELEVLPGTAVTFNRAGSATTVYNMVNGNILVYAGIASAP